VLCNLPGRYAHFVERVFLFSLSLSLLLPPPPQNVSGQVYRTQNVANLLTLEVNTEEQEPIPVAALVFVVFYAGRSLCDGPILRPEESYRVCMYVIVCD
jgi:hypothetical protein